MTCEEHYYRVVFGRVAKRRVEHPSDGSRRRFIVQEPPVIYTLDGILEERPEGRGVVGRAG